MNLLKLYIKIVSKYFTLYYAYLDIYLVGYHTSKPFTSSFHEGVTVTLLQWGTF